MTINRTNIGDELYDFLNEGAKEVIGSIFDEAVKEAVKQVEVQRDEFIAKTAVRFRSWTSMQDMGTHLVITIEKPRDDNLSQQRK